MAKEKNKNMTAEELVKYFKDKLKTKISYLHLIKVLKVKNLFNTNRFQKSIMV